MARRRREHLSILKDDDLDLNPLIDVITMLIVFFVIGGKISQDLRSEQITVPPTRTAAKIEPERTWERVIINSRGATQTRGSIAETQISVGTNVWTAQGADNLDAYQRLRALLDQVYERAEKFDDPKGTGLRLPKVVLEIRADADTQYRVVQEILQVATDTVDPMNGMMVKKPARPFVNINYTARVPGES